MHIKVSLGHTTVFKFKKFYPLEALFLNNLRIPVKAKRNVMQFVISCNSTRGAINLAVKNKKR
jgi:hypothetical protein